MGDVVLCDVAMGIISVDDVAVNAIAVDDVAFAGGVRSVAVFILPCESCEGCCVCCCLNVVALGYVSFSF